jgi:hypothetical protein
MGRKGADVGKEAEPLTKHGKCRDGLEQLETTTDHQSHLLDGFMIQQHLRGTEEIQGSEYV